MGLLYMKSRETAPIARKREIISVFVSIDRWLMIFIAWVKMGNRISSGCRQKMSHLRCFLLYGVLSFIENVASEMNGKEICLDCINTLQ